MKKNNKKKLQVKKNLRNFMKDESGYMTKENILKIGLGTVAALSMFSSMAHAGECDHVPAPDCCGEMTHTSDNTVQWNQTTTGKELIPSHTHHAAHCSY